MTNLVDKNLQLTLPSSVLTELDRFPESQQLQQYCEKFFKNRMLSMPNFSQEELRNYIPYMSKVLLMPIIFTKMIE